MAFLVSGVFLRLYIEQVISFLQLSYQLLRIITPFTEDKTEVERV